MPVPMHMRIQIRQFLGSVQTLTDQINEIYAKIRVGKKGVVPINAVDYVKLLEEVRRVEYIMLGITVSGLGVNLEMPDRNIPGRDFRMALDEAIRNQLEELNNETSRIILTDETNGNGN